MSTPTLSVIIRANYIGQYFLLILAALELKFLFVSDHFCALVEEVFVPIFRNELNMAKFPQCVSDGKILTFCQGRADPEIILFRH